MLSLIAQVPTYTSHFFHDCNEIRPIVHYKYRYLIKNIPAFNQFKPDTVITSYDPENPAGTQVALIIERDQKWDVYYFTLVNPAERSFNSLAEAQQFTLLHLTAPVQAHKQITPAPKCKPKRTHGTAWREAHLPAKKKKR